MDQGQFDEIFQTELYPFIQEVNANNPLIKLKNIEYCRKNLFHEYMELKRQFKEQIFNPDDREGVLDRHRIAACICGSFLCFPVFDKTKMVQMIRKDKKKIDSYFYYVNELVAFVAATKYLSMFMIKDNADTLDKAEDILETFPRMPKVTKNKTGFWNIVMFNLSQVNDDEQIGIRHFDIYSYAMIFYGLEQYCQLPRT